MDPSDRVTSTEPSFAAEARRAEDNREWGDDESDGDVSVLIWKELLGGKSR